MLSLNGVLKLFSKFVYNLSFGCDNDSQINDWSKFASGTTKWPEIDIIKKYVVIQ